MEESIMVMEKARPSLDSLAQLAPQLNKATDLYMDELKEIETALNKLNLGIEVERNDWIEKGNAKTKYNEDGEPLGDFYTAWTVGYGKDARGGWCLLVREYEVLKVPAGTISQDIIEQDATALLQASRDLRIAAADHIPDLLKQIEVEVKKKIQTLSKVSDKH
jgi:hypothetical protein